MKPDDDKEKLPADSPLWPIMRRLDALDELAARDVDDIQSAHTSIQNNLARIEALEAVVGKPLVVRQDGSARIAALERALGEAVEAADPFGPCIADAEEIDRWQRVLREEP